MDTISFERMGQCVDVMFRQTLAKGVDLGRYKIDAKPVDDEMWTFVGQLTRDTKVQGSMRLTLDLLKKTARLDHVVVHAERGDEHIQYFLCFFLCLLNSFKLETLTVVVPDVRHVGMMKTLGFSVQNNVLASASVSSLMGTCSLLN